MKKSYLPVLMLIVTLLLTACGNQVQPSPVVVSTETPSETKPTTKAPVATATVVTQVVSQLSEEALKNATYSGIYDEPVILTNGLYEGEPYVEGDPAKPTVRYMDGGELFGDLDGDGSEDAIVFLLENGGGTAYITYIAAQLNQSGEPIDAGTVRLDEVQVKSLSLDNGQVNLEVITQGPGDADCCGTHKARKSFAIQNGQLAETTAENEEMVQISTSDLNGTFWILAETNYDTPAAADVPVNIEFLDGQLFGFGGCNTYNASFTLGKDNPLTMTVSPIASTKMACPEPAGEQEFTYFMALESVSQWGYAFGRLALYYKDDSTGEPRRLLFEPGPVPEFAQSSEPMLTGQTWRWISFTSPVEKIDVESPENYTVTFNADGTLSIKADCNLANADYTDVDGALTVTVGPSTLVLCLGESRSEKFIQYLGYAARYFFQDGNLFIDLLADGGTMEFAPTTH